jgi:hypothetical protein
MCLFTTLRLIKNGIFNKFGKKTLKRNFFSKKSLNLRSNGGIVNNKNIECKKECKEHKKKAKNKNNLKNEKL